MIGVSFIIIITIDNNNSRSISKLLRSVNLPLEKSILSSSLVSCRTTSLAGEQIRSRLAYSSLVCFRRR